MSYRIAAALLLLPVAALTAQDAGEAKYEEVLQKLVDTMGQITKTLEAVIDEETAKASKMPLREQADTFLAARKQSQDLVPPSNEVRERLANKYRPEIEKSYKRLAGQIARVERVPGGNAALQEIRSVFEKNER